MIHKTSCSYINIKNIISDKMLKDNNSSVAFKVDSCNVDAKKCTMNFKSEGFR